MNDLRYSFRSLFQNWSFTVVAVFSIALGIGANTAIFSAVNSILLKSLPYKDVENLVLVWGRTQDEGVLDDRNQVSATETEDVRRQNSVFEEISTFTGWMPILSGYGEAERIPAIQVGDGYFRVMKGEPMLGRVFGPEHQKEGNDFVIVLGHGLWQRRFGGDPQIVGKKVLLNANAYTIIGVMPPDFRPLPESLVAPAGEFYRPVAEAYDDNERGSRHLRAIARLKPGISVQQAQAEVSVIAARLQQKFPDSHTDNDFHVVSLTEDTIGNLRPTLLALFGAVLFVMLVACANVGNLMIVRAIARQKELTVRAALGASRGRIIRQLLTESLLIALAGGVLGLLLALAGVRILSALAAQVNPLLLNIAMDLRVLLFTFGVSLLAGVLFGLAPAFHVWRLDLHEALKEGGRTSTAGTGSSRLRNGLVIAEIALTLMMLIGAGLLIQTVARLREVNTGFNPRGLLTMSIALPFKKYPEKNDWVQFYDRAIARLRALPGVESAGLTSVLPLSQSFDGRSFRAQDHPRPAGKALTADMYVVTADYLRAMQTPVLAGRAFTDQDGEDTMLVAIINQTMARQLWPAGNAIGKKIRLGSNDDQQPWRTIVGIVPDVSQYGVDLKPPMQFYLPHPQFPTLFNSIVLRSENDPAALIADVRREIRAMDPDQAVFNVTTMEELFSKSIALRSFLMALLIGFAFLAMLLAAVGIYGVISYAVTQRTHEFGIRMAIGAQQSDVMKLVLRHGTLLAALGILTGIAGAFVVTRLLTGFLYAVSPRDPFTFALVPFALLGVALLACALPALRAASVDPLISLRSE